MADKAFLMLYFLHLPIGNTILPTNAHSVIKTKVTKIPTLSIKRTHRSKEV